LGSISLTDAGSYRCTVTDGSETKRTSLGVVSVTGASTPLADNYDIENRSLLEGSSISFTVTASGGNNSYSYQWKKDGANLDGKTSKTLSFASIALSDAGSYSCEVTDGNESVTTSVGVVTVTEKVNVAPVITSVYEISGVVGTTLTYFGTATDSDGDLVTISYTGVPSWLVQYGDSLSGTPTEAKQYTIMITASDGDLSVSKIIKITVELPTSPLAIGSDISNKTIVEGNSLSFTVTATGGNNSYSYQWKKGGVNLVGKTAKTLSFASIALGDAGSYSCEVTDGYESVTTSIGVVTVTETANVAPVITSVYEISGVVGTTLSYLGTATDSDGDVVTISYTGMPSWFVQYGDSLRGTPTEAKQYTIMVTASDGDLSVSKVIKITVELPTSPLAISSDISNMAIVEGSLLSFTVTATGGNNRYSYQWKKDGSTLVGQTAKTLSFASIALGDSGSYSCEVTDGSETKMTVEGIVTVQKATLPLVINSNVSNKTVVEGSALTFMVTVTGGSNNYSYQWKKDDVILSGKTANGLFFASVTLADSGTYHCVVSDGDQIQSTSVGIVSVTEIVNVAPVISSDYEISGIVGTELTYQGTAADADGDLVAISYSEMPSWLVQDNDKLRGTPSEAEEYTFMVTASDGDLSTSKIINITVALPANKAPVVMNLFDDIELENEDNLYLENIVSHFIDPEGEVLDVTLSSSPSWVSLVDGALFGSPEAVENGAFTVVVKAADSQGLFVETAIVITVDHTSEISFVGLNSYERTVPVAFPNPVCLNSEGVEIMLPESFVGEGSISIFDVTGNLLDFQEITVNGTSSYRWDLKNEGGQPVASGTYVAIISTVDFNGETHMERVMIGVKQ